MKKNPINVACCLTAVPAMILFMVSCGNITDNTLVEMIEIKENWTFSDSEKSDWMEAVVPGCVHTDLIRNGVMTIRDTY